MMKRAFIKIFILILILDFGICIQFSRAKEKETIAIIDFEGQNVSSMDAIIVSGFLRTALVNIGKHTVVERKNMESILSEQGFQMSGCTTKECAVKIGKILNVRNIVKGNLSSLMNVYYITADIVDVETSQITVSKRVKCLSGDQLATAVDELAKKLVYPKKGTDDFPPPPQQIQKRQPVYRQPEPRKPVSVRPEKVKTRKPAGFVDLFTGAVSGKMDLTFENARREIHETELSMDFHYGSGYAESYYKISFEKLLAEGGFVPLGIRFGFIDKALGVELELSYSSLHTSDQDTKVVYNGTNEIDFSFRWDNEYITINSLALAFDVLFVPGDSVRPYIGAGIGLTLNRVSSDYIKQWYDPNTPSHVFKQPLKQTSLGFLLRIPLGIRLLISDTMGMFGEYRYSLNYFSFDRNIKDEKDGVRVSMGQYLFGLYFGF